MTKNMGQLDRMIRAVIAVLFAVLALFGSLPTWAAILLGILAVVMAVTSAIGFCPLYVPFKISTLKK